jgi:hypothetical protein
MRDGRRRLRASAAGPTFRHRASGLSSWPALSARPAFSAGPTLSRPALRLAAALGTIRTTARNRALSAAAASTPAAASLAPRLRSVDPTLLEVAEGHHDLRRGGTRTQELDDLLPQRRAGLAGHRGDALGIEEDHAGPADPS